MTEVLLFVGTASLLVFGSATLIVAVLTLRAARRYVNLAEERMERLREGQARLLALITDEHRVPKEETTREQTHEQTHEQTREQQGRSEELDRERRARRDAERGIDRLKRELQEPREAQREKPLPASVGQSKDRREMRGPAGEKALPTRKVQEDEGTTPTSIPETSAQKSTEGPPKDRKPRLGVRHPHPDDGVDLARAWSDQARARSSAPVQMFRKHYDKYLENYQGYVELAEHLYRMRDDGEEMAPGSFEERHWEERLRRVHDSIARTVARLDILEGHNPELAVDDRVSRRARVARRHSELGGDGRRSR